MRKMATLGLLIDPRKGADLETDVTEPAQGSRLTALYADTRGAMLVEYSVLIGVIAIAGSFGLLGVGLALVRSFDFVRGLLLCPIP